MTTLWCRPSLTHIGELQRIVGPRGRYWYVEVQDGNWTDFLQFAGWETTFAGLQQYPTLYVFKGGAQVARVHDLPDYEATLRTLGCTGVPRRGPVPREQGSGALIALIVLGLAFVACIGAVTIAIARRLPPPASAS